MRPLLLPSLLLCSLTACTSDVMLGQACAEGGCEPAEVEPKQWPALEEPEGPCAVQLPTSPHSVLPGDQLDRCQLFTLDALSAPRGGIFLTRAELLMTPASHHVDVRIAPQVPGLPDGEVSCAAIWEDDSIEWSPLLAAQGEWSHWVFTEAPFPITSRHRVLINHHYSNGRADTASSVGVKLNLHCTEEVPELVSESFAFEVRSSQQIGPGESLEVVGEGRFGQAVDIISLFRRTHLIEGFAVERMDAEGGASLIWAGTAAGDWRYEPEGPLELEPGAGLRFTCSYENPDFVPLSIGGGSSDACALLGIYQRPWLK